MSDFQHNFNGEGPCSRQILRQAPRLAAQHRLNSLGNSQYRHSTARVSKAPAKEKQTDIFRRKPQNGLPGSWGGLPAPNRRRVLKEQARDRKMDTLNPFIHIGSQVGGVHRLVLNHSFPTTSIKEVHLTPGERWKSLHAGIHPTYLTIQRNNHKGPFPKEWMALWPVHQKQKKSKNLLLCTALASGRSIYRPLSTPSESKLL